MSNLALGIQIAVSIVGGILAGIFLGYYAEIGLMNYVSVDIKPWGTIMGILVGIIIGGYSVYAIIERQQKLEK